MNDGNLWIRSYSVSSYSSQSFLKNYENIVDFLCIESKALKLFFPSIQNSFEIKDKLSNNPLQT